MLAIELLEIVPLLANVIFSLLYIKLPFSREYCVDNCGLFFEFIAPVMLPESCTVLCTAYVCKYAAISESIFFEKSWRFVIFDENCRESVFVGNAIVPSNTALKSELETEMVLIWSVLSFF